MNSKRMLACLTYQPSNSDIRRLNVSLKNDDSQDPADMESPGHVHQTAATLPHHLMYELERKVIEAS
jgi:hypothetical protein